MTIPRHLIADRGDAGLRLDLMIRRHLTDVREATRTRVQRWIESGQVTVNGTPVRRVATRTAAGDLVALQLPDVPPRQAPAAESLRLAILYEDDHLLAVDKPAGLVAHPTHRQPSGTLLNGLLWHARGWPAPLRPSLVSRLDKDTSGVVLVAKDAAIHRRLQQRLSGRDAEKVYLALVYGRVPARLVEIDLRLRRDPFDRRRVIASPTAGAISRTEVRTIARVRVGGTWISLVRCRLLTGRTHQLRVHLSASGWPIVGDPTYGESRWKDVRDPETRRALERFPRQALHASCVAFSHPITGERVLIEAALPRVMKELEKALQLDA